MTHNVDDSLVEISGFKSYRQDRKLGKKKTGGGVVTYINLSWCGKSNIVYNYSAHGIDCLAVRCYPRFSRHNSTIITNLYITPSCTLSNLSSFFDSYIPFLVPLLDENLHLIVGDFNHANTHPLLSFGLSDLSHSPTRGSSTLDRVITNHPTLFSLTLKAPVSSSDHCLLLVRPNVYSQSAYKSFTRSRQINFRLRNFSPNNLSLFNCSLSTVVSWFSSYPSFYNSFGLFSDTLKAIFDLCCPVELLSVCNGRLASPFLKALRREKECAYKARNTSAVKRFSAEIKAEIKRLDTSFANQLLKTNNSKHLWQGMRLLCGQKTKPAEQSVDVDVLNQAFIHPTNDTVNSYSPCSNAEVECFSQENLFNTLTASLR
ncbi:hypothetical protein [Streptococcus dysgalactiae]|uniref:hypothetical protein n=1 Tax=Streptococcus dysgalactiae TaxID=1334 RepID=UPI00194E8015|nr:hypothetical protein [Streptococcus dysgalactiae]MBM6549360.1 hypothetical protein [Streptococcus dysgalactiae subsp. equisimilis]